ncbi:MAG TPA: type IV toxin-antitoxin system AbiEi family antitoxin domain-containing protein [Solirubrobacterales bacterium]|nr:type IV toxin-antitoxin system AbiEi family antitoxin domain-containing protein [Solirubrobacterales bacterium]
MASLAGRQHGVVSRSQLLEIGVPAATIHGWVRRGHLHPLHRGVYAVGHPRVSQEGRWLAAILACGPGAVLSHGPAGQLLWIVSRTERYALHVSLIRGRDRSPAGIVTHRPRSLERRDTTTRQGIPTTTATRTVWDLATTSTPTAIRRAFEQAEKLNLLDRDRLGSLLAAQPSHKGAATLHVLLGEAVLPLAETRSRLEEIVFETCRDHSLPLPATNVPLFGHEVDFLWSDARFVVEADGGDHLNRRQRDRDNARDIELARAGYLVRRYSWTALADRDAVAVEIGTILEERRGS